ncbi:MAG TPA: M24 family metallopeptidase [Acidimicrobiales bacterium]|jgi:Xaa-Pro aminopeptidase
MADTMATPNLGTEMMEDRDRVHFPALRRARRDRVLAAMRDLDLDACVLGREDNVRYASGARRLWTASSRPFVPTCLILRDRDEVQLLSFSASYEGIPEEVLPDDFFPVTWNPMNFVERFSSTEGTAQARRVGFDGLSPFFEGLMREAFPVAEFVAAEAMMRELRRVKLPDEIVCLRTAAAIAESALYATAVEVRPGVTEKHLQATFLDRMCELGTSQFAQQGTFTQIDPGGGMRWITGERTLDEGAMVALAGGVLWAGYEGSLARTWWCAHQRRPTGAHRGLYQQWREVITPVVAACRPGADGATLRAAYEGAGGEPAGPTLAYSLGLGHEGPVAGGGLSPAGERGQQLVAGMVLGVRVLVTGTEGGYLGEEMVVVTDDGPELLTTLGHGALAGSEA